MIVNRDEKSSHDWQILNDTSLEIMINYPSQWRYSKWISNPGIAQVDFCPYSNLVCKYQLPEIDTAPAIVAIIEYKTDPLPLASSVSNYINQYKMSNFHINYSIPITLNNSKYPAHQIVYSYTRMLTNDDYVRRNAMTIITQIGGKLCTFTYDALANEYPKYFATVNRMMDTLSLRHNFKLIDLSDRAGISLTERRSIKLPISPQDLAADSSTDTLYVANRENRTVLIIDAATDKVLKSIDIKGSPNGIAFDNRNNKIYTANNDSISVINPQQKYKVSNIPTATLNEYGDIIVDQSNGFVFASYTSSSSKSSSGYVAVISDINDKVIKNIPVGKDPVGLAINPFMNRLYVANTGENYISIIDYSYLNDFFSEYTKAVFAGNNSTGIAFNPNDNKIFVANEFDNTVSVINATSDKLITKIPVGDRPMSISVYPTGNKIFVENMASYSVSVINDSKGDNVTAQIPVPSPLDLVVNEMTGKVYVSSNVSAIYEINGTTDKLLVGEIFNVSPANSGHIKCNEKEISSNTYIRIEYGTTCNAEPNNGFMFSSWIQNLGHNSSKSISTSKPGIWPFLLPGFDSSADFKITEFGNFTANFQKSPSPIPPEYLLPVYGVVIGWLIPYFAGWINGIIQRKRVRRYLKEIHDLNRTLTKNGSSLEDLKQGKISEFHFKFLNEEINNTNKNDKGDWFD